jgi:hypothetical protein
MAVFDVSQAWVILLPRDVPAARACGDELSRCIETLRRRAGLSLPPPVREDARRTSPESSVPIILLNPEPEGEGRNGFSWRLGTERLEIYGASERGLCGGVYDFLDALGFRWPRPGVEEPPENPGSPRYGIARDRAHKPTDTGMVGRKRLVFPEARPYQTPESLALWAARNKADALVLPLWDRWPRRAKMFGGLGRFRESLQSLAKQYAMTIEAGGWDLSCLLPRRYFLRGPDLFRMEEGRRKKRYNFCATNPAGVKIIQKEAERIFLEYPETEVFHLWPDRGHEQQWCACPSCRAFSPAEQNRIAVNTAADVLAKINPRAFISFYENSGEQIDIAPRQNMFMLRHLPGDPDGGDFLAP